MECDDIAVLDDTKSDGQARDSRESRASIATIPPSPLTKTRSLSDGGGTTPSRGRLSPSPLLLASSGRRTWKDDSSIGSPSTDSGPPVTPRRTSSMHLRGSSLQLPTDSQEQRQRQRFQEHQERHNSLQQLQQQQQQQQQKDSAPSTPVSSSSSTLIQQQVQQQLQQQQQQLYLNQPTYMSKPIPLSPKLDPSQIYASPPANILPRRSRGLDFSRAATSLHHSTLAEQQSPGSSPTISGSSLAAMNIPGRKPGDYGGATESSSSLWSMMGRSHPDKVYPSSSLGSANNMVTDSSSSSDDDDLMDDDLEEPFVTTPQVGKVATPTSNSTASNIPQMTMPWMPSSPAMNSLMSFQHRQRPRKQQKRKVRGPLGLGFSSIASSSTAGTAAAGGGGAGGSSGNSTSWLSRSPPAGGAHSRRESISWAANQLHISGSESDENLKSQMDGSEGLAAGQRGVIRRAVTRRGNLLPKTKGFARIRAALAEESAPVESEFRREAEVVRQVLESDMEPERLPPPPPLRSAIPTANSSPGMFDNIEDIGDDVMSMDASAGLGLSSAFRTPMLLGDNKMLPNKVRNFWEGLGSPRGSPGGSLGGESRATPPPPASRELSSGIILDDMSMDSPSGSGGARPMSSGNTQGQSQTQSQSQGQGQGQGQSQSQSQASSNGSNMIFPSGGIFPMTATSTSSSGGAGGPSQGAGAAGAGHGSTGAAAQAPLLPSAAEITRRINSKRRRDDDYFGDPVSFKRRAVSPGMSVHNSPIMQSPLQRDVAPWGMPSGGGNGSGPGSRPGSMGGGGSSYENKPLLAPLLPPLGANGQSLFETTAGNGSGNGSGSGSATSSGSRVGGGAKGRVGFQAMVDTNDSITRLSIE